MARQNALAKDRSKKAGAQSSPEDLGGQQPRRNKPTDGPAAAAELDRLIHERVRLAIVSALAVNESLTFNDLKQLLNTTDGNLSVHARKLEEAQYVVCNKYFDGRTPKTEYRLTTAGRRALERYLGHMESVIRAARGG
ncbi:MAG TPA: transcriptional regulator [Pyrinomonadaceae bacterium]